MGVSMMRGLLIDVGLPSSPTTRCTPSAGVSCVALLAATGVAAARLLGGVAGSASSTSSPP